MSKSRVIDRYKRSTEHLCDWLTAEHPALSPTELRDIALVIEDLASQTKKQKASEEFKKRFGGRTRRGAVAKATDEEALHVDDVLRQIEAHVALTPALRKRLLASHAKRLGYGSAKALEQAIDRAQSRREKESF